MATNSRNNLTSMNEEVHRSPPEEGMQGEPEVTAAERLYKSVNRLRGPQHRAQPEKKHNHGDPVIFYPETDDDAELEELKCNVHNPEFNITSNRWECHLVDKHGTYLSNGANMKFPMDDLVRDMSRS